MENDVDRFLSGLVERGVIRKYTAVTNYAGYFMVDINPADGKVIDITYSITESGKAVQFIKDDLTKSGYLPGSQ